MGNTLLGGVLGNWDKAPEEVYSSKSQLGLTEAANQAALNNLNSGNLSAYEAAINGQQPYLNSALGRWTDMSKAIQSRPNDPLADYRGVGDYWQNSLSKYFTSPLLANIQKTQEMRDRARGLNPGLNSSRYQQLLNSGLAQQTSANILPYIINNTGRDTAALANIRHYQDAFNLGLTPQEFDLRNRYAAQNLLPLNARNQQVQTALEQAMASAMAHKANVYGYHQPTNFWDKMDAGVGNVLNTAERVASIYGQFGGTGGMGGGKGGGGMGGMMGGMGGGGGQPATSQPNWDAGYARLYQSPPVDYNPREGNAYYGGYA